MIDAGLKRTDIGGAIDLRRTGGAGDRANYTDAYSRVLGLRNCFYFTVGRGGALAGLGMAAAMSFLDRGSAKYVVLMGAVTDWSQTQQIRKKGYRGMANREKAGYWGKPLGDIQAASHHSWMAARHMATYGTTSAQLGAIAVAQRSWACLNPEAKMYGRPITIDDHQNSPIVINPYHLLDMSQISDGGIAFILTTADRAKDSPRAPVYVLGQGFGEVSADLWWEKKNFTHMAVATAKEQAFGQADVTLLDVDCAQLYDCFTAEVLFQIEDYGWWRDSPVQHQRRPALLLSSWRSYRTRRICAPVTWGGGRTPDPGLRHRHDYGTRRRARFARHVFHPHLHLAREARLIWRHVRSPLRRNGKSQFPILTMTTRFFGKVSSSTS